MMKTSHIKVANKTLESIQENINWKINRKAFLFGSVAPDINCIFPAHTVKGTFKRFKHKLLRMDSSESNLIKSFTLGVITHYICDYFCYAHNLAHVDPKHHIYEKYMKNHIIMHEKSLGNNTNDIESQWNDIKIHIIESMNMSGNIEDIIASISNQGKDHIEYIMETINNMHTDYLYKTHNTEDKKWYNSIDKIELDLE